ncbi:MAG TPA: alanine racemase [Kofleriaceae bacterium]|nr:alanine racemase [Kofleriaceae bacterium]
MPVAAPRSIRPTQVEIDLGAVRSNAARLARLAGVDLFAVVKADGYGHGAVAIARALEGQPGVAGFAVSLVEEGSQLRDAGIRAPILVMGPALDGGEDEIVGRSLWPLVTDPGDLERLAELGRRRGAPVPIHLKLDTGMGRLGIQPDAAVALLTRAGAGIVLDGVATHFACAETDHPDDADCLTNRQLAGLDRALAALRADGFAPRLVHAANSAGTIRFPAARRDRVRCGIAVYGNGVAPPGEALAQAMRLVTHVAQLRVVPAGSTVSYGALWRATRETRAAILPVGYADGFSRRLTGAAQVLIGGRRCPVIGAISMDITVADVTALGDAVAMGDEAVLLGAQGDELITVADVAAQSGVVEYEVTCGVSKRVPRVYAGGAGGNR